MKRHFTTVLLIILIGVFWSSASFAIPAFARKHQAECTTCHSVWPSLNATGRSYKESGYRFSRQETSDFMNWDKTFPVSAVLKSRPYEKSNKGKKKLRILHEVELMVAGVMARDFSGFFELEAEDDVGGGFEVQLPVASIGWHPSPVYNLSFTWGPVVWTDPYDVYSNSRKLTRNRASVINERFGGADNRGRLRTARQNINLYGRPVPSFFYNVSISGIADDALAEDGDLQSIRLAYDFTPGIMVGILAMDGTCVTNPNAFVTNCNVDRDFSRTSIDTQIDIGSLRIMGAYLMASDDDNVTGTSEADNDAVFLEARYVLSNNGKPTWMPLIRLDNYEKNNGADDFKEITLHLSRYFTQNVRGFVEVLDRSGPTSADDLTVFTVQLDLAF